MKYLLLTLLILTNVLQAEIKPRVRIVDTTEQERLMGASPYKFLFSNFPKYEEIVISYCRVFQGKPNEYQPNETIMFDDNNYVVVNGRRNMIYAFDFPGCLDGERVQFRFSRNNQTLCTTSFVPCPHSAKSKMETFSVAAEIWGIAPITNYMIRLSGLDSEESVKITSISGREKGEFDLQKQTSFSYSPDVIGSKGGIAKLTFKRKNGDIATLELPWGTKWLDKLQQKLNELQPTASKNFFHADSCPSVLITAATEKEKLQNPASHRLWFLKFPKNEEISISLSMFMDEKFLIDKFTINDNNRVVQNGKESQCYCFDKKNALDGERIHFYFATKDGEICEESFVPNPISIKSKNQTFTVDAEIVFIEETMTQYEITLNGLNDGESFALTSISKREILETDNLQHKQFSYSPNVIGERGGIAKLNFKRKNGDRAFLELPWGDDLINKLQS